MIVKNEEEIKEPVVVNRLRERKGFWPREGLPHDYGEKWILVWEPSQKGFLADAPQRQR
jgi:hypothetical protein